MKRDFEKLKEGPFDLLVIGGGIFGAWTAYDAALRGLRVALVEKKDWAGETSSASSKLIHGGLRYLEHFWFGLVRKSLAERQRLLKLGPHRIFPIQFLLPHYQGDRVGRFRLKMGLTLYDLLGSSTHRSLSRYQLLESAPFLAREGLTGGFSYSDSLTDDARFTLEIVSGAYHSGAVIVNHTEVKELIRSGNRILGALVEDREDGEFLEVRASVTVNAAGPWSWELRGVSANLEDKPRLTKGIHLVMPPLPGKEAVILTARSDGRVFFLIPWYGATLLGTTDTDFQGSPDNITVCQKDSAYLLTAANRYFTGMQWTESDIYGSFAGLRVLPQVPGKSPSSINREWKLFEPLERLFISQGGKFTSSRQEASLIVDRVASILGKKDSSTTGDRLLPWCPIEKNWLNKGKREMMGAGVDEETARWCVFRYGSTLPGFLSILRESPELSARINPRVPFCKGEIVHAVKNEMARTLDDILRRRIPLSILSKTDKKISSLAADIAGGILRWNKEKKEEEIRRFHSAA